MVSVELIGGLGNQMFQIAACMAYAYKHDLDFHIPLKTANSHQATPYFTRLQNSNWDENLPKIVYQEPNFHFDEIPADLHKPGYNLILKGYFQSFKYFEGDYTSKIFELLYRDLSCNNVHLPIQKYHSIAIHVRKGDYELYTDKHPIVSVDYIGAAINYFAAMKIDNIKFFSDDPLWCAQMAAVRRMICDIRFDYDPISSFLDLMSHQHLILSNSTFGYWAAMMRRHLYNGAIDPKTFIIYPEKWFGAGYAQLNTKDMCPPDWIKM